MIFNSVIYENTLPQGMGVLEIADPSEQKKRLFIPLTLTEVTGTITGPLASFTLTQVFSYPSTAFNHPIEAIYRFPLPGDALITMAEVSFGDEVLRTSLQERDDAKDAYHKAFEHGRAALLLTREAADIFTLHLTGIEPGRPVAVSIRFLQYGTDDDPDLVFRLPLTTTPRYMRDDERALGRRNAEPLLMLLDPHHAFKLNVLVLGAQRISSPSHPITIQEEGAGLRVTLTATEVRPDRDFVLISHQVRDKDSPGLSCQVEVYPDEDAAYILATIHPPKESLYSRACRELIILVDHSGSMEGAKWEAADWAVTWLLRRLHPDDRFALGVFHTEAAWFEPTMKSGSEEHITGAIRFLKMNTGTGGTELGKALEEGLSFSRVDGTYDRHVIIITDAEVTDEGRLIRMIREEQMEESARRISMLCIDAAPNTPLVQEMVRVGGGIARFLTSEPDEQDITTALEKTLAWWDTPIMHDLFLEVNRDCIHLPDYDPLPGKIPLSSRFCHLIPWFCRSLFRDRHSRSGS